jgi:glyoxylase-like metal-dependent hydrolase (beta-lactamase superfamily II)
VNHLGHDRVICAYERDGVIVDPGPACSLDALDGIDVRVILLTHIHLDHAGGTGTLVKRFPEAQVYVHERGAPHVIDPSRLVKSATQLYKDEMDRLWGEIVPVPEENVHVLTGGETVEGLKVEYTPGHASHHVSYFDPDTGEAFTGDVAGVRTPPGDFVFPPTPPPDIDLERWSASLDIVENWGPTHLCLTHAGKFTDVDAHLARMRENLARNAECAKQGDPDAFAALIAEQAREAGNGDEGVELRIKQAAPPEHQYLGLERYWRKKREREAEGQAA